MNTLYKYFVIVLLFQPILGQDISNDDIIISKNDLLRQRIFPLTMSQSTFKMNIEARVQTIPL